MNSRKISVLIVDDETLARTRIKQMLDKIEAVGSVFESKNGFEAYEHLQNEKPDIIFLDIQMPEMTGIQFVDTVGINNLPLIIFVTAYDEYAVKAFEFHAVDYLLKPFDKDRFITAFERAKERLGLQKQNQNAPVTNLLSSNTIESKPQESLFVKESGLIKKIDIKKIFFIESSGNYLLIHQTKDKTMYRETMKSFLAKLPENFKRVHKSYIVNREKIIQLEPTSSGDYIIHLSNNSEIPLSRRYKDSLAEFF